MSAALTMDLRALGTASHIGRVVSDDEALDDTFDQAVTRAEGETFDTWCEKFDVQVCKVYQESDICLGLLAFCPFFQSKLYRDEALYDVGCIIHGGEQEYLDFIALPR